MENTEMTGELTQAQAKQIVIRDWQKYGIIADNASGRRDWVALVTLTEAAERQKQRSEA